MTMKRSLDDSDCDDFLDDDRSLKNSSPSQSCQVMDRKRRRGVIEKRRRDRINQSLSELKRLVPSAFEKQGSAKLEKAEILQMTTEHLKMLQARGLNNPASFEVDYRSMGFRECVAEVARYLAAAEGMDLQNPLRLRLVSHLEAYGAQKEVSLKHELSGYNTTHWHRLSNYAAVSQNALYPSGVNQDTGSLLSSKLKEPNYGSSYSSTVPPSGGGVGNTGSYFGQPTSGPLNPAYNPSTTSLAASPQSTNSFTSSANVANVAALGNLSPNALYGSTGHHHHHVTAGHYGGVTDAYKFRPW